MTEKILLSIIYTMLLMTVLYYGYHTVSIIQEGD